jgi:hypothetical protein
MVKRPVVEALYVVLPFFGVFIGAGVAEIPRTVLDMPLGRNARLILILAGSLLGLLAEQFFLISVDRQ